MSLKDKSEKSKKSIAFYKRLRSSSPALFKALARQAKLAIEAMQKEKSPAETAALLKNLMGRDKEMDPRKMPDTFGVRLFIDAMLTKPEERSKAKRFYLNALENLVGGTSVKTEGKEPDFSRKRSLKQDVASLLESLEPRN